MIILRQKLYFLAADGSVMTGADIKAQQQKMAPGTSLVDAKNALSTSQSQANAAATAARQSERNALKAVAKENPNAIKNVATKARAQGYQNGMAAGTQAGIKQGAASVGIKGGIQNTWRNAGAMGKIGMAGAAAGGAILLAKGAKSLFDKKNKD